MRDSTPPRFPLLTSKTGDFDRYATRAILDMGVISRVVSHAQLSTRIKADWITMSFCWSLAPPWLPLIAEDVTRRILSDRCVYDDGFRASVGSCGDLAFHHVVLNILRLQGTAASCEAVAACTRKLVTRYLFSGGDPSTGDAYHPFSRNHRKHLILDAAMWLGDAELLQRLCSKWGADQLRDVYEFHRGLDFAAGPGNLHILEVVNSLCPVIFSQDDGIRALLSRACLSGNEDVFHFALDRADELDDVSRRSIYLGGRHGHSELTKRCPSVGCYQRLTKSIEREGLGYNTVTLAPPRMSRRVIALVQAIIRRMRRARRQKIRLLEGDENGAQRVGFAAKRGNLEMVRYFVGGGALEDNPAAMWPENQSPEARENMLCTGLVNAVSKSHVDVARFLQDSGAPLTERALLEAVRTGTTAMVRLLVERGADVNAGVPPPISLAVFNEDMELFRYLIRHGASLKGDEPHAGAWAMTFARFFQLHSMRAVLEQYEVPLESKIYWVLDRDGVSRCPIQTGHYRPATGMPEFGSTFQAKRQFSGAIPPHRRVASDSYSRNSASSASSSALWSWQIDIEQDT